ncbi:ubiquinol-cytochrome c reductase iron-sulfur subunit [soil metagenome]
MMNQEFNQNRRRFLVAITTLVGSIGAFFAAIPFLSSWLPSAQAKAAGAPLEVDISHLAPGGLMIVEWRGKPIWIIRRTQEMLAHLTGHNGSLRDPNSLVDQQPPFADNIYRSIKPEYLVLVGICTHLGCSPTFKPNVGELSANWPGGFYCPCHGSTFDLSGRVFKGVPAPTNLVVPPYRFLGDNRIVIGE